MKKYAFKTIVNLRGENPNAGWYRDEKAISAAFGAAHIDIMLSSKRLPSREALMKILDALKTQPAPVLIKCSGGSDRTGLIAGLHLVDQNGAGALAQARAHLRAYPYIHCPKPQQRWIKAFWDFFEDSHNDMPLRTWLEKTYSDEAFAAFLTARGQGDFWRREWR